MGRKIDTSGSEQIRLGELTNLDITHDVLAERPHKLWSGLIKSNPCFNYKKNVSWIRSEWLL